MILARLPMQPLQSRLRPQLPLWLARIGLRWIVPRWLRPLKMKVKVLIRRHQVVRELEIRLCPPSMFGKCVKNSWLNSLLKLPLQIKTSNKMQATYWASLMPCRRNLLLEITPMSQWLHLDRRLHPRRPALPIHRLTIIVMSTAVVTLGDRIIKVTDITTLGDILLVAVVVAAVVACIQVTPLVKTILLEDFIVVMRPCCRQSALKVEWLIHLCPSWMFKW